MPPFANKISLFWAVLLVFFALCSAGVAQKNVDLEFVSQKPAQLRGGEKFIFQSQVVNLSEMAATDVRLRFDGEGHNLTFLTVTPSQGECQIYADQWLVRCSVGAIKSKETVTVSLEAKVNDFGGDDQPSLVVSKPPLTSFAISGASPVNATPPESLRDLPSGSEVMEVRISGWASAFEQDLVRENDYFNLLLYALPSKNAPPHIEIIAPAIDEKIRKAANKLLNIPVSFKAFDPDGKVADITVINDSAYQSIMRENPFRQVYQGDGYKYFIGDKKYSAQELNDFYAELGKKVMFKISPNSNGTYSYIWKALRYGRNDLHISATDDGGRTSFQTLTVEVIK